MIARSASGSFRDALGTLDQLVAFGGSKVELDAVLEMLGAADAELLFEAVDAVLAEDPKGVLLGVEKMARSGRDPSQFARDLLAHLRHLLVTQTTGEVPTSFVVTATDSARLEAQACLDRTGHPGAHDRRAGERADRRARGRRRADGRGDRAAQSGTPRSGPQHRGIAASVERLEGQLGGGQPAGPVAAASPTVLGRSAPSAPRGTPATAPPAAEPSQADDQPPTSESDPSSERRLNPRRLKMTSLRRVAVRRGSPAARRTLRSRVRAPWGRPHRQDPPAGTLSTSRS